MKQATIKRNDDKTYSIDVYGGEDGKSVSYSASDLSSAMKKIESCFDAKEPKGKKTLEQGMKISRTPKKGADWSEYAGDEEEDED